jgi:hypothetical protein
VTWVGWRLGRTEALIAVGILGLLALLLVPTGIQMADAYRHDGIGSCLLAPKGSLCGQKIGEFEQRFQSLNDLANWFTLVPGLIGVLLAAPFILDLEHGTYRLAWTQSITRGRWLAGKLGFAVLAALLAGGALILLFTWWRAPEAHLYGRLDTGTYDSTGTVVFGYTLFALGLALALGALWRRSAVSLVIAFLGYFSARIFVDFWLRDRLVSPLSATWKGNLGPNPRFLDNAHVMSLTATLHGHQILRSGGGFLGGKTRAEVAPGVSQAIFHAVYQPESHFWPLQLTETALFVGVAALLIGFAIWWTRERIA